MAKRVKIVVTVPVKDAKYVCAEIGRLGGGKMGNYSFCSYSVVGKGRFMPNDDAHPTIGKPGRLETVKEERIEVTCDESSIKHIVKAIREVHPYEEPVIDVYPLISPDEYK